MDEAVDKLKVILKNERRDMSVDRNLATMPTKDIATLMRRRSRRRATLIDLLFYDWPASKEMMENLYGYISATITKNNEPVIYCILDKALNRYRDVVFCKNGERIDDPVRIGVFVETLIVETCRELEVSIYDAAGAAWSVDSGQPFLAWLQGHPGSLMICGQTHENESALRQMLYCLITSDSIKKVLRRGLYDQDILAGRLAADC